VLRTRLVTLSAQVRRTGQAVRDEEPDGVQQLRVAMRRTRSLLRTFRSALPDDVTPDAKRLCAELRWAGLQLSGLRDLEVVHGRLAEMVEAEPEVLGLTAVVARLGDPRSAAGREAALCAEELLASARFADLVDVLDRLAVELCWEGLTPRLAREQLRKDWRRLRRRAREADQVRIGGAGPDHLEEALHEVRKAAKRARYAAETLTPAFGARAARMAAAAEQVQETLGGHRDTLLTRDLLGRLAAEGNRAGEDCFWPGRLYGLEQARGEQALAAYMAVHAELERKRHRRWLG
jgi:CHAD domain-containing protein